MYKIIAVAPTAYQLRSVRAFGPARQTLSGKFIFEQNFDTEEEAKEYLNERALIYSDSEEEYKRLYAQIECGCLELDAVTGSIINVTEEE